MKYSSPHTTTAMVSRLFTVLIASLAIISCSEPTLEELKAQRAALDQKIRIKEKEARGTKRESIPVTAFAVAAVQFDNVLDVRGTVESKTSVIVTPRGSGTIIKLNAVNGQSVSKGQLLVEIDSELIRRSMEEVQTQLDLAITLYEKQKRIYDQKAGSEIQYLQAKNQKESLEKRMSSLKEQLELNKVYAATSGIVDNVVVRVGENVGPGMPLFSIINTGDMRAIVELSETYVKDVNVGDRAKLVFPELGDTVNAAVGVVSKNVNSTNRTFSVEIPLRNVPASLRPNMTCTALITDRTIPEALVVPISAIVREGSTTFVYVIGEAGKVSKRSVSLGQASNDKIHVLSGLTVGENIVNRGVLDIAEGMTVTVLQ
ncbi:MAG: efflux RND transporter periplasmic adaptor subunit [Candidatus Kapabacteria bacterium]|nr:efflux RND transporter periplasmic adaptor subunit [Candidatus Kapabacteria bacterium]